MSERNNTGTVIVCVTVMFCFTLAVIGAITWAVPDGAKAGSMATIILTALAPTIAAITILVRQDKVREVAASTDNKMTRLLNGEGQAKITEAVHEAMNQRDATLAASRMVQERDG